MRRIAVVWLFVAFGTAHAEDIPPNPEGAERVRRALVAQFGQGAERGGPLDIGVTPQGYALTVDLTGFVASLPGVTIEPPRLTVTASEQTDGLWRVTNSLVPSIGTAAKGAQTSMTVGSYRWAGIFDPRVMTFRSARSEERDIRTVVTSATEYQLAATGSGLYEWMSEPASAGGGVDGVLQSQVQGGLFELRSPILPGTEPASAPLRINYRYESAKAHATVASLKTSDVSAFIALASHQPKGAEAQSRLHELVERMGAPVRDIDSTIEMNGLTFGFPGGEGRVAQLGSRQSFSLVDPMRAAVVSVRAQGLSIDGDLGPIGSALGVPRDLSLTLRLAGPRLDAAFTSLMKTVSSKATGQLAANAPLPDLQAVVIPDGDIVLNVEQLSLAGDGYRLGGEGALSVHVSQDRKPAPAGHLALRAHGVETLLDHLKQLGASPQGRSLAGVLALARSLGRPTTDGGLEWVLDLTDKGLVVNGLSVPLGPGRDAVTRDP